MKRDKEFHHGAIVETATAEFLRYGFQDASMRRIAAAAGMSVSGLYKHFSGKEEMFSALVDPVYQGLLALCRDELDAQREIVGTGDLCGWESDGDAKRAVSYIYDHLDAFRLIVCKSQGTKYENVLHDLAVVEEESTLAFMEYLKSKGAKIRDFDRKEFHLLTSANVNAIFQCVTHGFNREEAMHYAETLDRFFSRAWSDYFGF